ncbi:hypothetical protein SLA2020_234010 [Shorea laevis]
MASGNLVLSDKMQFPTAASSGGGGVGGVSGGEIHQHHPHQWFIDERDSFISWLRGEFAAANAIVDSLCHHLCIVGEPGEYDAVLNCIQQRRCNWNSVLHLQQYFSVAEVTYALQQVTFRRQQTQRSFDQVKGGGKEFKRTGMGFKQVQKFEVVKEAQKSGAEGDGNSGIVGSEKNEPMSEKQEFKSGGDVFKVKDNGSPATEDKKDATTKPQADIGLNKSGSFKGSLSGNLEAATEVVNDGTPSSEDNVHAISNQNERQNLPTIPKTFRATEEFEGKMVDMADGLRLYEELFDEKEVAKFVSLVNDLRAAGKRGHLQGQTYIASKRPMRGHGREMIQFGHPISDAPLDDESAAGISKDRRVEAIPSMVQDAISRLVGMQIMTVKPDCCIIDIYNEGDHSQPHLWPSWFGKPICVLFLTECDITFGRVIVADHPGDYRGTLRLSLAAGSLLVMQGKSAEFAKYALPSIRKQRMLITFTKYQPRKTIPNDNQRLPSPAVAPSCQWGPSSRLPNHVRHTGGLKHYTPISATGVLPAPPIRPQLPPNGVQSLFTPTPITPAMPFPTPVPVSAGSTGWATAPRHPPPRLHVPGTGVFLPPSGSGNPSSPQQASSVAAETSSTMDTSSPTEKGNDLGKSSHGTPKEEVDRNTQHQDNNKSIDGTVRMNEEQQRTN